MSSAEFNNFVEKVREQSDIYSVVSRYVPLTLKGNKYWACFPFHGEKTASFTITPEKGLFYCFGCHAGGNVFKFISMIENISYFDAIKLQAERLGIALPARNKSKAELEREDKDKFLYQINEAARKFYHDFMLKTEQGNIGRKYFNARGISNETIENFNLGYAPNSWDNLMNELLRRGYTLEQMLEAGVVSKSKKSEKYFDRMRDRVIIPITDLHGRTVAFGGRILDDSLEDAPKYLNSPESAIFKKGNLLFGLDKSNRAIFDKKFAVVVEGYMDAIALFSAGFENVVASLGTAFTEDQARLLLRYTRKIIFCYDSDEAGQRATMRALPIAEKVGLNVSAITITDSKDPDEFIRKHGKDKFSALIENALPIFDYRLKYILSHSDIDTLSGKIDALKNILPVFANMKDPALISEYYKKLSGALFLDENIVEREFEKFSSTLRVNSQDKVINPARKSQEDIFAENASELILRMAWSEPDILDYVLAIVPREAFTKIHLEIIDYLLKCMSENKRPDDMSMTENLSPSAAAEISGILLAGSAEPRDEEIVAFSDSVQSLKKFWLKKNYDMQVRKANELMAKDFSAYCAKMQDVFKMREALDRL